MTNKRSSNPSRSKINQTGCVSPFDRQNVPKIFLFYFKNGEISNICVNAIEAMGAAGGYVELLLEANLETNQIGVCFKDSGPGIAAVDIPKLFEPFFTTKSNGTGLGLPICLEIFQRHGGQITIDSMVGRGTTFVVWLPLVGPKKRTMKTKVFS